MTTKTQEHETTGAGSMVPWQTAKRDAKLVAKVLEFRKELDNACDSWGDEHGIYDLTLTAVFTASDPERKVYYFWNPRGGKDKAGAWYRYREGDDVPRWLQELGKNAKNYRYPDGRDIPPEALAKKRGRSDQPVLTSVEDLL